MRLYNRIMLFFWLAMSIVITSYVTVKSISEGFERWGFMYMFAFLSVFMFLLKRWMMKRYQKRMQQDANNQ